MARNILIFVMLATMAAAPAYAIECKPAGSTVLVASTGCDYGVPARSGELLLVPKVCRLPLDGKLLDRHSVEVRLASTGAKVGQASLPPAQVKDAKVPLPQPGMLLGGAFPLLVLPVGIAAIEGRSGRAELVFEPQGRLLGVARLGEVLAVVEEMPADDGFPKGSLEWTVLDFGAGDVLGSLRLAGVDLAGLALRTPASGGLEAVLERTAAGKHVEVVAMVRDAAGKTMAPGGTLAGKVRPLLASLSMAASGCEILAPANSVVLARPRLVVAGAPAAASVCLAVTEVDGQGRGFAWWQTATGSRELRTMTCR
jgi:hypothetical protein